MTCPYCKRAFEGESCQKKRCREDAKAEALWQSRYAEQSKEYYSGPVHRATGSRFAEPRGGSRRNGMYAAS